MTYDLHEILLSPRFWVAVSIVAFAVLAGRKMWSAATGILDQRAATIRAELDEASALRAEAEKMLADACVKRDAALKEAADLVASAQAEAGRLADEARDDAAKTAVRREKMALDRIAAAEKAAITEVRNRAAAIAAEAAEAIIREGLPQETAAGLVRTAIENLPGALRAVG